ncbi:MAG: FlgD immunoglobulin-like domain containing protein [bacterium]|nr:FlgD immunoglobulin-like domain containing protein [bacterium]
MEEEAGDSIIILGYNGNTPFVNSASTQRIMHYLPGVYPTTWCDGSIRRRGISWYQIYRNDFDFRKTIPALLTIGLTGSYDPSARTGSVTARINNTTDNTINALAHCVIVETDIPYAWQGEDSLFHVVRNMIPISGMPVSIPGNSFIDETRSFTMDPTWVYHNSYIVVFVQDSSDEIYQAAKMPLLSISAEENSVPRTIVTLNNSPTPFTSGTTIRYSINNGKTKDIQIGIYDITGSLVKQLVNGKQEPGNYMAYWDGKDARDNKVGAGIYFCVANIDNHKIVNKMVLTR